MKPLSGTSAVKIALMAREVRAQVRHVLQADPIAIVGMGCRVPGADSPQQFWDLLRDGIDATGDVPAERWDSESWYDPDASAPGRMATNRGGFLGRIDGFDAMHFGILGREAERMDPQQRLFLEVAVEALDDAGCTRERLRGSRTGVFVAAYHDDYTHLQYDDLEHIDARTLTGTLHSVLANRLSFFLDLRGPSLAIDTACSSSLVAVHLACQSLRMGESDLAVAGGVSLIVAPPLMVAMSKVGFMSPDGRCKTFAASADGFGRGEGCGAVVLKRLSDALADGDRVLGVVRGSAVNQDGHSTVLAAPSGPAQEALILEALDNAQLEPGRIGYVEAHGTGTALGDPIEVEAIASAVGQRGASAQPCLLGSAKANLGHLEAAAGVTGLIKTVLSLRAEAVPPQLHLLKLNPHLSLAETRLVIPTELTPWPKGAQPRCAAVSSFGVGGTNAHVIIEEAPELGAPDRADVGPDATAQPFIVPLSAQTPQALRELVGRWVDFLGTTSEHYEDIAYTASQRRSHHGARVAVSASSNLGLAAKLKQLADALPEAASGQRPKLAFAFSGQGPQWFGMGRELMLSEPVFRDTMTACDALLEPLSGWSLLSELARDESNSRLAETEYAQPALFAVQVALVALWKSLGVVPDAVVGHSVGEIAALHAAGALDLPQAIDVVWHRARLMQKTQPGGAMASLTADEATASELIAAHDSRLCIGAVNGPRTVVLSGDRKALEAVLLEATNRGIEHRLLPVQYAFHSPHVADAAARLDRQLGSLRGNPTSIPIYSTVTGASLAQGVVDAHYFRRNVADPVRFGDAVSAMLRDGCELFLEIGPHPVLGAAIDACISAASQGSDESPLHGVTPSMRRGKPERDTLLQAVCVLHSAGIEMNWDLLQPDGGEVVSLPAYPWQRKRHWIRQRPQATAAALPLPNDGEAASAAGRHPVLGRRTMVAGQNVVVHEGTSIAAGSWLHDHRIFDRAVLPAAAIAEAFIAAANDALQSTCALSDLSILRPALLPEDRDRHATWQTVVKRIDAGHVELELHQAEAADSAEDWQLIATATAAVASRESTTFAAALRASADVLPAQALYASFTELGVQFGPAFRCVGDVRHEGGVAEAWCDLPPALLDTAAAFIVHPTLIDAALQLCSVATGRIPSPATTPLLPVGIERVWLAATVAGPLRITATVRNESPGNANASSPHRSQTLDIVIASASGVTVGVIEGARFVPATSGAFASLRQAAVDALLYDIEWRTHLIGDLPGAEATGSPSGLWLVFSDLGGVAAEVVRELAVNGQRTAHVIASNRYGQSASGDFTVDPGKPEHFDALLADVVRGAGPNPLRGVVHLWSLDTESNASGLDQDAADLLSTGSALHLVQALTRIGGAPLTLVTRGAQAVASRTANPRAAGLWGLAGVVAAEHPELHTRIIDLDPSEALRSSAARLFKALNAPNLPASTALRGDAVLVPRLVRHAAPSERAPGFATDSASCSADDSRNGFADLSQGGDPALPLQALLVHAGTLDGTALQRVERVPLQPRQVRLRVIAAGLNFRDVMLTLGLYPGEPVPLGAECSGIVIETSAGTSLNVGDIVYGYAPGAMATEVVVHEAFLAVLPAGLSAADCAALPVAFFTALHGLDTIAGLRAGERVLIHAAAGGVGLAAVQWALHVGAEVFATAGSEAKRALLESMGVRHVMDSRSLAFADQIRSLTEGAGVDVILNSLSGDFVKASFDVLALGGRFLELGKRDAEALKALAFARPDARCGAYDLGSLIEADPGLMPALFDRLQSGLTSGSLRPLPRSDWPLDELAAALRHMAQARHTGKLVVLMPKARASVRAGATYWITGGLGALGLHTAGWLADQGATRLVLTGRKAAGADASSAIAALEQRGVQVSVRCADTADRGAMRAIADEILAGTAPLAGVFHAAGALRDGVLSNQRWSDCLDVMRGKAHGAFVLDELTRHLPLDFFVLYSAANRLLGAAGQGVYSAANAQLEALAAARRDAGLAGMAVAWGAWAGAGMAARSLSGGTDSLTDRGLGRMSPDTALRGLQRLLGDGAVFGAVLPIDWTRFSSRLPVGADRTFFEQVMPLMRAGTPADTATTAARWSAAPNEAVSAVARIRALPPAGRWVALLALLTERAVQVLDLDPLTRIDEQSVLKEAGLDSLMAVELRNALVRSVGVPLPATLLFDHPTLAALTAHLMKRLEMNPPEPVTTQSPASAKAVTTMLGNEEATIAELSDEEAEALLLEELDFEKPGKSDSRQAIADSRSTAPSMTINERVCSTTERQA